MRKLAFQTAAVLALASAVQLQAAQAQQAQTCLTRPELRGMVAYFLPTVLQSAIDTCTPRLAPDSYLVGRAPRLLTTLESARPEAWPMAKQAFMKMSNDADKDSAALLASLPESAVRPLIEAVVAQKLGASIKPENCGDIDRVMTPLEPLPAANLVDVLTEAMAIAGRGDKQLRACKAA